jgi:carbon storage regulator
MLVLTRKTDESIIIRDNIAVTVIEIRGDRVRLGIEAPRDVPVHRREVYDAIKRAEGPQMESLEIPVANIQTT